MWVCTLGRIKQIGSSMLFCRIPLPESVPSFLCNNTDLRINCVSVLWDVCVCGGSCARTVQKKFQLTWVPLALATFCMGCRFAFRRFGGRAKKHCHYCGRVFCDECAQAKIRLRTLRLFVALLKEKKCFFLQKKKKLCVWSSEMICNVFFFLSILCVYFFHPAEYNFVDPVRVCQSCFDFKSAVSN